MKTKLVSFLAVLSLFLVSCEGNMPSKQVGGAVVGGVVGGVAGNQIGKGRGRTAAIIAGTLLGAALGSVIGQSMEADDASRTEEALESGQPVTWTNPGTQNQYTVTPTGTFQNEQGQNCRRYTTVAIIDGQREDMKGAACRQDDGSWKAAD